MATEAYSYEGNSPPARNENRTRMIVRRRMSSNVCMTESYHLSA